MYLIIVEFAVKIVPLVFVILIFDKFYYVYCKFYN